MNSAFSTRRLTLAVALAVLASFAAAAEVTSETHEGLQRLLERYPEADLNRDGILTMEEARRFRTQLWQEESDVGVPIERDAPAQEAPVQVRRFSDPQFAKVPYGALPGQVFDLWLPRRATPPCPTVICLTLDTHADPPQALIESALADGMAVGMIHGRDNGDGETYFEDVATGLQYLYERSHAYGIRPDAIGLFGATEAVGQVLYGSLLVLESEAQEGGIRGAALIDAPVPPGFEELPDPEAFFEAAYPRAAELLDGAYNTPRLALLHTGGHGGDLLQKALRLHDIDAIMHNAADNEGLPHLLRAAALFFAEILVETDAEKAPPEPEKEAS